MKKLALVDLDGVLNNYSGFFNEYEIPPIKNGAREFLEKLSKNYDIEIFTLRNKIQTVKWLQENEIDYLIKDISNVKNKYASIIIDDRAINFNGDYELTLEKVNNFKPHWL